MDPDDNRRQQAELYGAALADLVGEVTSAMSLSQAAVARTLGMSAPMLSQLVSGQRLKIGNPRAVHRLQALLQLAAEVRAGLPLDAREERLRRIQEDQTGTLTSAGSAPVSPDPAAAVTGVLRAVASGQQLRAAADLLDADHPGLAEVLRTYGLGSPEAARAHHRSLEL